MVKPIILNQEPMSLNDVRNEIAVIKKRDEELNFRTNKTEEYLNEFVNYPSKVYEELKKKIEALEITRLKPEMLVKILDILPETMDDIKNIMHGFVVSVNQDDLKRILKVIEETVPAK